MDLRGHGPGTNLSKDTTILSCGPMTSMPSSPVLGLDRPVLCGWRYGPLLILDYVRHYGENHIGGFHFVDALTKLGSEEAVAVLTPEILSLISVSFRQT